MELLWDYIEIYWSLLKNRVDLFIFWLYKDITSILHTTYQGEKMSTSTLSKQDRVINHLLKGKTLSQDSAWSMFKVANIRATVEKRAYSKLINFFSSSPACLSSVSRR